MNRLVGALMSILWIMGVIFANGFWSTLFCIIPFWSYYIVIEHFLKLNGMM